MTDAVLDLDGLVAGVDSLASADLGSSDKRSSWMTGIGPLVLTVR